MSIKTRGIWFKACHLLCSFKKYLDGIVYENSGLLKQRLIDLSIGFDAGHGGARVTKAENLVANERVYFLSWYNTVGPKNQRPEYGIL